MHDLCCIGHITLDKIVTPKNTVHMAGGTAFYFSHAIKHFNDIDYSLITALAESEMKEVDKLRSEGIDVAVMPSKHSVYFENIYGENQDNRTQRVLAKAVYAVDWTEKEEALKYIHFLKANEHEMEVLTGHDDVVGAALKMYEWGVKEVLITLGSLGSVIYDGKTFHKIPAYKPREVVDATGCGDTYMTGYLYQRAKGASIDEAGRFAAAMSTIKIEASGPFSGSKEDVIHCMETAEQKFPEI